VRHRVGAERVDDLWIKQLRIAAAALLDLGRDDQAVPDQLLKELPEAANARNLVYTLD
jgi:hypothetical protein